MSERLLELSKDIAALVKGAAPSVVRVDGHRCGSSSGIVWGVEGLVLTAYHGIEGEDEVSVGLSSGETIKAELVGCDPTTDLAVLRVKATGLPAAELVDRPLEVGELVLCVTRPGRGPKVGLGIVSRLGEGFRTTGGGKVDRYIELGFALHHGFSGGLVLDLSGGGLGLGTAGLVRDTPLAVPAATLRRIVKAILLHGGVRRGYLGVASIPVRLPSAAAEQIGQTSGLLITAVEEDSPAGRAGVAVGDLMLAVDGAAVSHLSDLMPLLEEERIGGLARAKLWRGGQPLEVALTVGARGGRGKGEP
ncbi:MAG TPA: S1C family serine protease [Anaeromyxobacteraceae bacterium]|nr:S1C family serine protease [Anaeromyxobacteraceae bacterium]